MIRLEEDSLGALVLDDWETGIVCSELNLGWPASRAVSSLRPGGDGAIDETRYVGARLATVKLSLFAGQDGQTRRSNLEAVARYCHPRLRPRLVWADPTDGVERELVLRPDDGSAPMTNPTLTEASVSWVVPSGVIRTVAASTALAAPMADVPGLTLPIEFPLTFPSFVGGPVDVTNEGSAPADWIARLYGPCTGPTIENLSTGQKLSLPGLGVDAGHYIELDSAQRTVRLDGIADASRYSWLDFAASEWWVLDPGTTSVAFTADVSSTPSQMEIIWQHTSII